MLPRQGAVPPAYGCGVRAIRRHRRRRRRFHPGSLRRRLRACGRHRRRGRATPVTVRECPGAERDHASIARSSGTARPRCLWCPGAGRPTGRPARRCERNLWRRSARRRCGRRASPAPGRPGTTRRGRPRRALALRVFLRIPGARKRRQAIADRALHSGEGAGVEREGSGLSGRRALFEALPIWIVGTYQEHNTK